MLVIVGNGRINDRAPNQQFMSVAELKSKLREEGVHDVSAVKLAVFASSGEFSAVQRKRGE